MKRFFDLLRKPARPAGGEQGDSTFFSSAFAGQGLDSAVLVPWEARAVEVGARRLSVSRGSQRLQQLWSRDRHMSLLPAETLLGAGRFFEYASVSSGRDIIRQDEYSNFLVIVMQGTVAVDRQQPWGEQLRLAEARPGDMLGEMSLLDGGTRFSACTTLTDCEIAVLGAESLDEMMASDPHTTAGLVALLARKLSLRLRAVSARVSEARQ